ncbi:MAG: hypothetical protein KAT13_05705 [Methanosarcinales archaeon]|nr:hypothetical protein [Methanosarcinales archaeon]MCK4652560.1 hypothetical protein [Methanosarcinales archaeon]MCK4810910.1 hypothetical protein [Methanosarcinales archaeon]
MARRCRLDIIIEILGVISSGTTKTKIVYKTNLNFNIATTYLEMRSRMIPGQYPTQHRIVAVQDHLSRLLTATVARLVICEEL